MVLFHYLEKTHRRASSAHSLNYLAGFPGRNAIDLTGLTRFTMKQKGGPAAHGTAGLQVRQGLDGLLFAAIRLHGKARQSQTEDANESWLWNGCSLN